MLQVVERDPAVDQPIDRQPARQMERGVGREVPGRIGKSVVGAQDPAAAVHERIDRERRARLERRHPDQDRRPAHRQALDGELHGRDAPDGFEHVVRAAIGQFAQRLDHGRPVVRGDQPIRGADRSGDVEFARHAIDGDDARRAREDRTHHAREPDPTKADDSNGLAGRHGRRLPDGPHTGRDAAADECRDGRVDAVRQRDGGRLWHDRRRRHRADRAVRQDGLAVGAAQDGGTVEHAVAERRGVRAGPWLACSTRSADPARDQPRERHGLTDRQRLHPRPDRIDDPRTLVAHRHRRGARPVAVADVQVGMADAGRLHPHPDLARPRFGQRQRLHDRGLAAVAQDRGPDRRHVADTSFGSRSTSRAGVAGSYGT